MIIHGVSPGVVPPRGGEVVTVQGDDFLAPLRVELDFGGGDVREAQIVRATRNELQFITPQVDIAPPAQRRDAQVVVAAHAGLPDEHRTTADTPLRFQNTTLQPVVTTVTPSSVTMSGGAQVHIFGEGFEAPSSVRFGEIEGRVLRVDFDTIIVEVPAAAAAGAVPIHVRNFNSQTETTWNGFAYSEPMRIDSITPDHGPLAGGTEVVIRGGGFPRIATVTVAGVPATLVQLTPEQIVLRTPAMTAPQSGAVEIVDLLSGATASGGSFQYVAGRRRAAGRQ